ncbi:MAG: segregation/condensation protein A, partial [bacterium]
MGSLSISSLSPIAQFKVQTTDYVGPMDLMVYLIQRRELEVCSISLSAIASDFLSWLDANPNPELDHIGDFLLLAAILVDYKFRSLFNPTEEQDTSVEIAEQMREYSYQELQALNRQVKILANLEEKQLYLFERGTVKVEGLDEGIADLILSEVSLYDIALAFRNLLERLPTPQTYMLESSSYT